MANCGCVPCKKPLPKKQRECKPFMFCVGNKTIIWDGKCLSEQPRKYQIPNGTYTSITFTDGCITGVGQAPLPQYTPQGCCDNGEDGKRVDIDTRAELVVGKVKGNLVQLTSSGIVVTPQWDTNQNIQITGDGTVDKPWKPKLRISNADNNTLVEKKDGLFANLFFKTSGTVEVTGKGVEKDPYILNVKGAEAKLPVVNKDEVEGNGFTIDQQGRFIVDEDLKLLTNLEFSSEAFSVVDAGAKTMVVVDEVKLKTGTSLVTTGSIKGKGTADDALRFDITETDVETILDVIGKSDKLKTKLKQIIGV